MLATLSLCGAFPSSASPGGRGRTHQEGGIDGAARHFVALCAPCHGETGDGKGTAQLDRQARSFREGGFSYGNTLPALYRSITTGIPGTPMPGFEVALKEEERRALAEYVLSLGPPDAIAESSNGVMTVSERPQIVRGLLPPIVEGASERVRGLFIGTPVGTSFEYRIDDVRLLGVRAGEFVERRDWVGRGGDALQPLGTIVHLHGGGDPRASFLLLVPLDTSQPFGRASGEERELAASLAGTHIRDGRASLSLRVVGPEGELHALVEEELGTRSTSVGSGWTRRFRYRSGDASGRVLHRFADDPLPEARIAAFAEGVADPVARDSQWAVLKREQGGFEARRVIVRGHASAANPISSSAVWLDLAQGRTAEVEVLTLLLPEWSHDVESRLRAETTPR